MSYSHDNRRFAARLQSAVSGGTAAIWSTELAEPLRSLERFTHSPVTGQLPADAQDLPVTSPAVDAKDGYATSLGVGHDVSCPAASAGRQAVPHGDNGVAVIDHQLAGPLVGLFPCRHHVGNLHRRCRGKQIGEFSPRIGSDEIVRVLLDRQRQDSLKGGAVTAEAFVDDEAICAFGQGRHHDEAFRLSGCMASIASFQCPIDGDVDLAAYFDLMVEIAMSCHTDAQCHVLCAASPSTTSAARRYGCPVSDVFVSYSHVDRTFVRRLHEALTGLGKQVWVDDHGIPPASRWADYLKRRLKPRIRLCL